MERLDEILLPELSQSQDVSTMSAIDSEIHTASGRSRTDAQRFTKPLLYH